VQIPRGLGMTTGVAAAIIRNASVAQTARTTNRIRRATLTFSYNFGRSPQSTRRVVEDDPTGGGARGGF
jgi:hypothetical protein